MTSEPAPSIACATCNHDLYIHPYSGYGGCLYGDGCECAEFVAQVAVTTDQKI